MIHVRIQTVFCLKYLAINRVEVGGEAGGRNEVDCSGLAWPARSKNVGTIEMQAAAAAV